MKKPHWILRFTAVTFSLLLAGGFIWFRAAKVSSSRSSTRARVTAPANAVASATTDQAGELEVPPDILAKAELRDVFPSTKSDRPDVLGVIGDVKAHMFQPTENKESPEKRELMSGSKSALNLLYRDYTDDVRIFSAPSKPLPERVLMAGSKSDAHLLALGISEDAPKPSSAPAPKDVVAEGIDAPSSNAGRAWTRKEAMTAKPGAPKPEDPVPAPKPTPPVEPAPEPADPRKLDFSFNFMPSATPEAPRASDVLAKKEEPIPPLLEEALERFKNSHAEREIMGGSKSAGVFEPIEANELLEFLRRAKEKHEGGRASEFAYPSEYAYPPGYGIRSTRSELMFDNSFRLKASAQPSARPPINLSWLWEIKDVVALERSFLPEWLPQRIEMRRKEQQRLAEFFAYNPYYEPYPPKQRDEILNIAERILYPEERKEENSQRDEVDSPKILDDAHPLLRDLNPEWLPQQRRERVMMSGSKTWVIPDKAVREYIEQLSKPDKDKK